MSIPDPATAEGEGRYHNYSTNVIPWYVRVMWLAFWFFIIAYTIKFLFPAVQVELVSPP